MAVLLGRQERSRRRGGGGLPAEPGTDPGPPPHPRWCAPAPVSGRCGGAASRLVVSAVGRTTGAGKLAGPSLYVPKVIISNGVLRIRNWADTCVQTSLTSKEGRREGKGLGADLHTVLRAALLLGPVAKSLAIARHDVCSLVAEPRTPGIVVNVRHLLCLHLHHRSTYTMQPQHQIPQRGRIDTETSVWDVEQRYSRASFVLGANARPC